MNDTLEKDQQSGLLDNIKIWIKQRRHVSVALLQINFSISFPHARKIMEYLQEEGYVEQDGKTVKNPSKHNPFSQMKIYLIDLNPRIVVAWKKEFSGIENVKVIQGEFAQFLDSHPEIDGIVSPANSFGYMDGGYDEAITAYFGAALEEKVQRYIEEHCYGEQPVGTAIVVDIPDAADKKLVHVPTMRLPSPIADPLVVYQCMRITLIEGLRHGLNALLIPAFGGATGGVKPEIIAKYMKLGYQQIDEHVKCVGPEIL